MKYFSAALLFLPIATSHSVPLVRPISSKDKESTGYSSGLSILEPDPRGLELLRSAYLHDRPVRTISVIYAL